MELIPTLPLFLMAAILVLLALAVVCLAPDYGLFIYGLALGFPDRAVPLGTAINLRLDDTLMILFLIRVILWKTEPLAAGQKKILKWQALFLAVCVLSALFGFVSGNPPALYETFKMLGCGVILFVLPRLLQSSRRLASLIAGLMCAGAALVLQIVLRLGASPAEASANFQEYKNAATFATWNANTIGQAAMLSVFAAGIGWFAFGRTRMQKVFWLSLATGFALMPAMVFARGTTLSIAAGTILFLVMSRHWRVALLFALVAGSALMYLRAANISFVQSATRVDLATGEGFSHRYDRWEMALETIKAKPIVGYGFGREWDLLSNLGSEGRAHNAYLTVWLELGAGGLLLFLGVIYQFVSEGRSLYGVPESRACGALLLALIAAMCLDSLGLPTLYWEKLPIITLAIGVAVVGLCGRAPAEAVEREYIPSALAHSLLQ
jgi:O-antigen ligase